MMDSQKAFRVDEASATVTYIGDAAIGVGDAEAFWRIRKLTITGSVTSTTWADGNEYYDNVWSDRASLSYS